MKFSINYYFIFLYVIASLVFIVHYVKIGSGVWGDGRYYYSYVRSVVIDKNFDFKNESEYFKMPIVISTEGKVLNKFSIAPAILWLPFFITAHILTLIIHTTRLFPLEPNGYSHLYQILVGLGSIAYVVAGLQLCFLVIRKYFCWSVSFITILSIFFATNLFFYGAVDPINSHSVSFFIASCLLFFSQQIYESITTKKILITGFLVGFLAMIRNQDAIWMIVPIVLCFIKTKELKWKTLLKYGCLLFFSFSFGFFPQLIVWKLLFGKVYSPYLLMGETFNWLNPQFLSVLFSVNNGLFFYSPILFFACLGWKYLRKKNYSFTMLSLILFSLQLYIIASWHSWWGGASYGSRMFISIMPLFTLGLAAFVDKYRSHQWLFILGLFTVLNISSITVVLLKT